MSRLVMATLITMMLPAAGQSKGEPTYAADVPDKVTTPDVVETNTLGTLKFFDGMPAPDTVARLYDNLDLIRATTAFLDGIRIASIHGLLHGYRSQGVKPNEVAIHAGLMDARSIWLTPNTTTIYIAAQVDVSEGPVVIEAPAGLLGILDDAAFEYVTDIGAVGPDKGKGGKYLIVPNEYEGPLPEAGYFTFRTKTYDHWLILRGSPDADGSTEGPVATIKAGLNIYPLSAADNPPEEVFHDLTGVKYNTVHANNFEFFEEVNAVIQKEPEGAFNPEILGTSPRWGSRKGSPLNPMRASRGS